jgi:hypothetical protein
MDGMDRIPPLLEYGGRITSPDFSFWGLPNGLDSGRLTNSGAELAPDPCRGSLWSGFCKTRKSLLISYMLKAHDLQHGRSYMSFRQIL